MAKKKNSPSLNREFEVLLGLICESISEFRHYDPKKIAVSISRSKGKGRSGLWAYVVPLRYVGGRASRKGRYRGRTGHFSYESPKIAEAHPEALYLMSFLFPRFFYLKSRERLETIVHELYHLHPTLRGDLRRFAKPHVHHGPTPALFNRKVKSLTAELLRNLPEIQKHPLILGSESDFATHVRKRLPLPRRTFRAEQPLIRKPLLELPLFAQAARSRARLWFWGDLILSFLLSAQAQAVSVRNLRETPLFQSPSARSRQLEKLEAGQSAEFIRYSSTRRWMYVEYKGKKGWIPSNFVDERPSAHAAQRKDKRPEDELGEDYSNIDIDESAFENAASGAPDSPGSQTAKAGVFAQPNEDRQRRSDFDSKFVKFYARTKSRIFGKPTKFAERFGIIEPGDELKVLGLSRSRRWAKIRLLLTGEEGWFPSKWIVRKELEHLEPFGPHTFSLVTSWGSNGANLAVGAEYLYNLFPEGFEGAPRNRLELGFSGDFFFGSRFSSDSSSYAIRYLSAAFLGRYIASSDDGLLSGGIEVGGVYLQSLVNSQGLLDEVLSSSDLASTGGRVGFLVGGLGFLALSEGTQLMAGVRSHIVGEVLFSIRAGMAFRF